MTATPQTDRSFYCPPEPHEMLPINARLAVGFGDVIVTKDDDVVWSGDDEAKRLAEFEARAAKEGGTWRVEFYGPLIGTTYERRNAGEWVLIARNEGFA